MPKVDKPIIGGDVSIETPPETIDPEMKVPEMLAPAPKTDSIYNPPMQQGVQQANMLNEFLKQATGEKPLASLNIGDYVQCATAKISLFTRGIFYGESSANPILINYVKLDVSNYEKINIIRYDTFKSDQNATLWLNPKAFNVPSIQINNDYEYMIPENVSEIELYFAINNPESINIKYEITSDILVYPTFK